VLAGGYALREAVVDAYFLALGDQLVFVSPADSPRLLGEELVGKAWNCPDSAAHSAALAARVE